MRRFARTSRCAMVAAGTANAAAIAAASMPSTVCNISGVRQLAAIAGCAQTSMSSSRRSGIASSSGWIARIPLYRSLFRTAQSVIR